MTPFDWFMAITAIILFGFVALVYLAVFESFLARQRCGRERERKRRENDWGDATAQIVTKNEQENFRRCPKCMKRTHSYCYDCGREAVYCWRDFEELTCRCGEVYRVHWDKNCHYCGLELPNCH